jgi:hypothetical protein
MIGFCFRCRRNRRRAFTLMEILLTTCLLVILAALAWPALDKPFAGQRLRKAADRIRAEWCSVRVEAMESGQTYLFRYTANDNRFRVECYSATETEEDPVFGDVLGQSAGGLGYSGAPRAPIDDTLPEGVTFVASETATDTRATMIASEAGQLSATDADWSEPILFYPDGTTSTARLVLKNEHDRYIELLLRGLTGMVNIGEVYTSQE